MRLYALLDRLLPRSYLAKVLLVAVLLGQAPLLVLLGLAASGAVAGALSWPALIGTALAGLAALALGLAAVLRPVSRLEAAFAAFEAGRPPERPLPEGHADAVGRLMARAARLMRTAETRIDAAQRLAERDPLTGLLNRRGLERSLAARRGVGERGAVLMMDLDHFKRVNDEHGHDTGDWVLREVADLLRNQMRRPDLAARFGGEEFVIYLSGLGREAALRVAERLRMAAEDGIRVAGRPQTVSIGVTPWPPGAAFSEILKRADGAVYAAKAAGRNCVRFAPTPPLSAQGRPDPDRRPDRAADGAADGGCTPGPVPGPPHNTATTGRSLGPTTRTAPATGIVPATGTGPATGTTPATGTGPATGIGPGTGTGTGSHSGAGTHTGAGADPGLGSRIGTDLRAGPGPAIGSRPAGGTPSGPDADAPRQPSAPDAPDPPATAPGRYESAPPGGTRAWRGVA